MASGDALFEGTDVPVKHLFQCLEQNHNLNIFLHLFPSVTREQALAAMKGAQPRRSSQPHT